MQIGQWSKQYITGQWFQPGSNGTMTLSMTGFMNRMIMTGISGYDRSMSPSTTIGNGARVHPFFSTYGQQQCKYNEAIDG
jgi:hypothetical protein